MNIRKNMGVVDRIIRIVIALIITILYFTNVISGTISIILIALSVISAMTSFIGFCPLYVPLGISSKSKKSE